MKQISIRGGVFDTDGSQCVQHTIKADLRFPDVPVSFIKIFLY